ncbi:Inorganic phosphate transporter 1 [Seminavis robusta]|uniref:Inorganic phosphate transporter 1 n=1 Tax=Seminavis robusta TaxID=568900 RepID=A0A9N8HII2_9STRA|nr:Inorganic phosphate transporter 1 [Seminavis robusta]|eukprot:Sro596_g172830.1 Inorganic phosphate transporter 1 (569) ;mRNA; r:30225-31931
MTKTDNSFFYQPVVVGYGSIHDSTSINGSTVEELISLPPLGSTSNTIASTDSNTSIATQEKQSHARNSTAADLRLSMLSNFSTAYNVISISLALDLLSTQRHLSVADKSLCSSALFAGMIAGQLGGGALGDVCGRHIAMMAVMLLQVLASLLSSLSTDLPMANDNDTDDTKNIRVSLVTMLAFWRFVLGVGCGGVYPLAATLTAESSNDGESAKARRVALAFSFQGVGYLTVPVVALMIVWLLGEASDLAWRLLLGLGAVPGIVLTFTRVRNNVLHNNVRKSTPDITKLAQHGTTRTPSVLDAISQEPQLWRKMLGTAGCWLLFDIAYYGNIMFQPIVLACAFGEEEETAGHAARDSALIAALALPGYFMSYCMVNRQSPRFIQIQGFLVMAVLYACIAAYFEQMSKNRFVLLGFYGATFFSCNYGPNSTTFMLPAITYSKECRSTLNGVCAASGKVGALLGSIVFARAVQRFGQAAVFASCAWLSVIGALVTFVCVQPPNDDIIGPDEIIGALERGKPVPGTPVLNKKKKIPSVYSLPSIFDFYEVAIRSGNGNADNSREKIHVVSS